MSVVSNPEGRSTRLGLLGSILGLLKLLLDVFGTSVSSAESKWLIATLLSILRSYLVRVLHNDG